MSGVLPPKPTLFWCTSLYPVRYLIIILSSIINIVPTLAMVILVGYSIKQLQSTPALVSWNDLLGEHASRWVARSIRNTEFADGIQVSFQAQYFPAFLIACAFISTSLKGLQEYVMEDIGERISRDLRLKVVNTFLSLDLTKATGVSNGLLAQLINDDPREVRLAFGRMAGSVVAESILAVIFFIWLLLLDTQLFFLLLAVLLPAYIIIRVTGKTIKKHSRAGLGYNSELLNSLLEKLRGWQTIKVHNAIDFELDRFSFLNNQLYNTWRRVTRIRALGTPLVEWLAVIAAALVAFVALKRIAEQALTAAVFSSFLVTIAMLANSLQTLTTQINSSKRGAESLRRLGEFFHKYGQNSFITSSGIDIKANTINKIEAKHISIANSESGQSLSSNINFSLKTGDVLAIIGASGTGKSTLLRVLLGLEKQIAGEFLYNGESWNEDDFKKNRKSIAFIPQDPFLFDGELADNITYPNFMDQNQSTHISKIMEAVNLQKLPGDKITGLSGGEKQRLILARALYADASLIIVDEGTSALDLESERFFLNTLIQHSSKHIIIIVAHRPMVRELATHVLDLSDTSR